MCWVITFNFVYINLKKKNICKINTFKINYFHNSLLLKLNNLSKKKYLVFCFKLNNNFYYNYNFFNKIHFKIFFKAINNIALKNQNFLFLDNDYKYLTPLTVKIYGVKNILNEKNFFFLKKSFLVTPNWLYLYKIFLKKHKINSLIILNYFEFNKFFNIFLKLNLPIFSIIPLKCKNIYLDFYFYVSSKNHNLNKTILYNYVSSIILNNFNFNYQKKKFFFNHFFKKIYKINNL